MIEPKRVVVGAAIIYDNAGHILIAQRNATDPLVGGLWEFPGGKVEPGESLPDCITREIQEEIGIAIAVGDFFARADYVYSPQLAIELHAYTCTFLSGEPLPLHCQAVRWLSPEDLMTLPFAPADIPFVHMLTQL